MKHPAGAPGHRRPRRNTGTELTILAVMQAGHEIENRLEGALLACGLSLAKYGVLHALAEAREPLTLTELAERLSCVRSNITQLMDRLEADGLVRRYDDPDDRRIVRAALTALGVTRHDDGVEALESVQHEFDARVPGRHRAALSQIVSALT
jgi:DNA-binding MarR family transcriptional regulator